MAAAYLVPLLVIGFGICVDLWIYGDAKQHVEDGNPVVGQVGNYIVDTPAGWAASCAVMSIIFIPLYLTSRA